ncbi:hypothetical protein C3L33_15009, partial [Rhododendron williamsianum]
MATSSVMQSILVSPVAGDAKGLGSNRLSPYCRMPHQSRSSSVVVRCTAEDGQKEQAEPAATPSTPSPLPTPPPPPKAKVHLTSHCQHRFLRRVRIQWAGAQEDQRQARHDRLLRGGDHLGAIQGRGRVRPDIQRRDSVIPADHRYAVRSVADSSVQQSDRGVEVKRVLELRCCAVEREICYAGFGRIGFHRVCQGWGPCVAFKYAKIFDDTMPKGRFH